MATNHEELLSAQDAAAYMGVSERQLRTYVANGHLRRERAPKAKGETRAPAMYSRADLDAIKRGKPNEYDPPAPTQPGHGAAAERTGMALAVAPPPEAKLALPDLNPMLERIVGAFAKPAGPMFIEVEEVVRLSGLSRSRIQTLAPLWAKRGDAIRARGGWKIRRAALDAPLPTASA